MSATDKMNPEDGERFGGDVFAGRRFAVLGLGRSGLASAQALVAMGASVTAWDDDPARRQAAGVPIGRPAGDEEALILSPGIAHLPPAGHPLALEARARNMPVWTDAELLYRAVRASGSAARFVGITGTNGKSTTTALLAHILAGAGMRVQAGANLGPAALSLPRLADNGVYCLEMSSYMLERLATLRFDVAAMLNLSPDHLDRHGDMDGYAQAKRAIFARQRAQDTAVIGIDDAYARDMARAVPGCLRISGSVRADVWADGGRLTGMGADFDLRDAIALPGAHNAQNAAAAWALASALGVSPGAIAEGLASYPGLPHRQQTVARLDGVDWINDSKATNADAAAQALGCYERVVWIAGGVAKAGGIAALAPYFPRVAEALLIGRDAAGFAATLAAGGVRHRVVDTLERAVAEAAGAAARLDAPVVLLSPAAASFDQFGGFEQRGTHFAALVQALPALRGAA